MESYREIVKMSYWDRSLWGLFGTGLLIGEPMTILATSAAAKSHGEVAAIAKASTVKICPTQGSGIIVAKAGNIYTVLTNRHVLEGGIDDKNPNGCTKSAKHSIVAPDGQKYLAEAKAAKNFPNELDLATIRFRSNKNYPVAQIGNPAQISAGSKVHTAGYLASSGMFKADEGLVLASSNRTSRLTNQKGYSVVYDAYTINGMSGSGVWNDQGQVIAIHGFGWRFEKGTISSDRKLGQKLGWNMGIPINRFLQNAQSMGLTLPQQTNSPQPSNQNPSTDDYFIAAADKYIRPGGNVAQSRQEAIEYLNTAIKEKPDYAYAYFLRGYLQSQLKNYPAALADYNRAISLNPKFTEAYRNRGILKFSQLKDPAGAFADFNQAISIAPKFADAYIVRALVKHEYRKDYQGALQDYNQAIAINATIPESYFGRALLKQMYLKDYQGALQDYERTLAINPNYIEVYYIRSVLKQVFLQDSSGALADYNRAIEIDNTSFEAYHGRGFLKALYIKDFPGALADYNRAIAINSKYLEAYINRGLLKANSLKDFPGALADYNRAIAINPNSEKAYYNRGALKANYLKDNPGALADYNRAIALAPNGPEAYAFRALLKQYSLSDKAGAIKDFRTAARLYKAQGRQKEYQLTTRLLQELGVKAP
jgi:tetratricopeptide (TPR) repeat protein